jgi:hypothetical protein
MTFSVPVMEAARGEARKATRSATSLGRASDKVARNRLYREARSALWFDDHWKPFAKFGPMTLFATKCPGQRINWLSGSGLGPAADVQSLNRGHQSQIVDFVRKLAHPLLRV